jgi:hypothetical protein
MKTFVACFLCFVVSMTSASAQPACTAQAGQACAASQQSCGDRCRQQGGNGVQVCYKFCCNDWVHCLARNGCSTLNINCN